jgi:hypothetical protein
MSFGKMFFDRKARCKPMTTVDRFRDRKNKIFLVAETSPMNWRVMTKLFCFVLKCFFAKKNFSNEF